MRPTTGARSACSEMRRGPPEVPFGIHGRGQMAMILATCSVRPKSSVEGAPFSRQRGFASALPSI
jgi:hypothetical protein